MVVLSLLLTSMVLGPVETTSATVEPLPITPAALAAMPRAEVRVEAGGKATLYAGVPLAAVLARRARPVEGMPGLRELSDGVILVRGEDGYRAAVSAAAVLMDAKGERYLLATSRDGQARPPQLIIPADPQHARWVRDVVAVGLLRLDAVNKPNP